MIKTTKEKLFQRWQCFSAELGDCHPDTLKAKKEYFEHLSIEREEENEDYE